MNQHTPDITFEDTLETLTRQAEARWGESFAVEHLPLLEQAAQHILNVANSLPETETEPGFFQ